MKKAADEDVKNINNMEEGNALVSHLQVIFAMDCFA